MAGNDSIRLLRGNADALDTTHKDTILSDGQPLYDKTNNWLCIGNDGKIQARRSISVDFDQDALSDSEVETIWGNSSSNGNNSSNSGSSSNIDLSSIIKVNSSYIPYWDGSSLQSSNLKVEQNGIKYYGTSNDGKTMFGALNHNGAFAEFPSTNSGSYLQPGNLLITQGTTNTRSTYYSNGIDFDQDGRSLRMYYPSTKPSVTEHDNSALGQENTTIVIQNQLYGGPDWYCVGSKKRFVWNSTAIISSGQSGITTYYVYRHKSYETRYMIVADIWVNTPMTIDPENKSILGQGYTVYDGSFVPLFAALGSANVLYTYGNLRRMEIINYNWITDTNTNTGKLNGNGFVFPKMQSNDFTEADGINYWFPYVGGVAVELDTQNKNNKLTVERQHYLVRFYNSQSW